MENENRINCLDREIRYQGHASKKRYGFLHSTLILGGKYLIQKVRPYFMTFMQQTNISFFKWNVERVYNVIALYI